MGLWSGSAVIVFSLFLPSCFQVIHDYSEKPASSDDITSFFSFQSGQREGSVSRQSVEPGASPSTAHRHGTYVGILELSSGAFHCLLSALSLLTGFSACLSFIMSLFLLYCYRCLLLLLRAWSDVLQSINKTSPLDHVEVFTNIQEAVLSYRCWL